MYSKHSGLKSPLQLRWPETILLPWSINTLNLEKKTLKVCPLKEEVVPSACLKVNGLVRGAIPYVNQHIAHSVQVWLYSSETEGLNAKSFFRSSPLSSPSYEFPLKSLEVASWQFFKVNLDLGITECHLMWLEHLFIQRNTSTLQMWFFFF